MVRRKRLLRTHMAKHVLGTPQWSRACRNEGAAESAELRRREDNARWLHLWKKGEQRLWAFRREEPRGAEDRTEKFNVFAIWAGRSVEALDCALFFRGRYRRRDEGCDDLWILGRMSWGRSFFRRRLCRWWWGWFVCSQKAALIKVCAGLRCASRACGDVVLVWSLVLTLVIQRLSRTQWSPDRRQVRRRFTFWMWPRPRSNRWRCRGGVQVLATSVRQRAIVAVFAVTSTIAANSRMILNQAPRCRRFMMPSVSVTNLALSVQWSRRECADSVGSNLAWPWRC